MVLQQFKFVTPPPPLGQGFLYVGETVTVKPSYVIIEFYTLLDG